MSAIGRLSQECIFNVCYHVVYFMRLAYAYIWDIYLHIIFQPWLVGDNLQNVEKSKVDLVKFARFVPVVGLIVYHLCLDIDEIYK